MRTVSMDKMSKDFQFMQPPPEANEPPPRNQQKCSNCNAFRILVSPLGPQTACCAEPPTPIFLGTGQTKTIDPRTGQPQQYPIVIGFMPSTDEDRWCRQWQWAKPGDEHE